MDFNTPIISKIIDNWIDEDIGRGDLTSSSITCLLYTSDAADDTPCVDLGGRRIIKNKLPFDLLSIELRDGIQNLSKITGQELTEELLDSIFSKFCIGK